MKLKIKLLIGLPFICVILIGIIFSVSSNEFLKDIGFWMVGIGTIISFIYNLLMIIKEVKSNKKRNKVKNQTDTEKSVEKD